MTVFLFKDYKKRIRICQFASNSESKDNENMQEINIIYIKGNFKRNGQEVIEECSFMLHY